MKRCPYGGCDNPRCTYARLPNLPSEREEFVMWLIVLVAIGGAWLVFLA